MKNIFLPILFIILAIFIGCGNNEKKAQQLIKDELFKSLNDFKSYEPIEFSKLDSSYSTYKKELYKIEVDTLLPDEIDTLQLKFEAEQDLKEMEFKPEFSGYQMSHTFRSKNPLGGTILSRYLFKFDKDVKKIVEAVN